MPPGAQSAEATRDHGAHVAGTVAGNVDSTGEVKGVPPTNLSGIAHSASLGNYNVFPNNQVSAGSVQIIAAIEDAVDDGMDVINLSLGGTVTAVEEDDPMAVAINNAAEAGVIAAISAGNSGPGPFTIGTPGRASRVLTAGASTNPHFVGQPVDGIRPVAVGAVGDFKVYQTIPPTPWVRLEACPPYPPAIPSGVPIAVTR